MFQENKARQQMNKKILKSENIKSEAFREYSHLEDVNTHEKLRS